MTRIFSTAGGADSRVSRQLLYSGAPVYRDKSFLGISAWYLPWMASTFPVEIDRSLYSYNRYCFVATASQPSVGCSWGYINRTQGAYDWTYMDQWVNYHASRGVDLLYSVGAPCPIWGNPSSTNVIKFIYSGANINMCKEFPAPQYFCDWVTQVGTRYKGKIKYWLVANEPLFAGNPAYEYVGTAADLAVLNRLAYQILKSIDPNNKIMGPESSNIDDTKLSICIGPYMTASAAGYDAGFGDGAGTFGKNWLDYLGFHPYTAAPDNRDQPYLNAIPDANGKNNYIKLKDYLTSIGVGGLPLWAGEIMYMPTNGSDEYAFMIRHAVIAAIYGVEKMTWFDTGGSNSDYFKNTTEGGQARTAIAQMMKILASGITQVDIMTDNSLRVITLQGTYYV